MARVDRAFTSANTVNSTLTFGIAIPAYRNPERLRKCLNAIAVIDSTWLAQATIVDDSGDGSVAIALRQDFPQVNWIVNETNQGFIPSANRAVSECRSDIVLLLNDDVELHRDPRSRAAELFMDQSLFALSLRSVKATGETREGGKRVVWRGGIARVLHNEKDQYPPQGDSASTDYAVGGHALFRRSMFLALGGFDARFKPFYWEDADLSARAARTGLRILYLADSEVFHNDAGAIKSTHAAESIRRTILRNRLLYSSRHAAGVQRLLFPVGLAFLWMKAALTPDKSMSAAITDFFHTRRS